MKYSVLFERAERLLNDAGVLRRWPEPALCRYAGTILRRMAEIAPWTCAVSQVVPLAAGSEQALPPNTVRFLGGLYRAADGRPVRNVRPEAMDALAPGWRGAAPSEEITDCVYDPHRPTEWAVFPPAVEDTELAIRVTLWAPDPVSGEDDIPVNPINELAMVHGLVALCLSEDTDAADLELAARHMGLFYESLGVSGQVDRQNPPAAPAGGGGR